MSPFDSAKATLRVKINQIAALIKVSILKATNRVAVRSKAAVHAGTAAAEAEVARGSATKRTAPIVTVGTDIDERTNGEVAVARHGQFKW